MTHLLKKKEKEKEMKFSHDMTRLLIFVLFYVFFSISMSENYRGEPGVVIWNHAMLVNTLS